MHRFTGTVPLTRFALRRDRILLPVWIAIFPLLTVLSASATMALYPSEISRTTAARAINDVPSVIALYGRVWDPTSLGELSLIKLTGLGTVFIAILAIMLVVRHTRADEERGRTELIGSEAVGSLAQLAAAVLVSCGAMVAIGVLSAFGLAAIGLPTAGAWAFGATWMATGCLFAMVAAVTAQLAVSARGANALAILMLAIAYVLRAIGDATGSAAGPSTWAWLSPIGWAQQVRPFAGDRFALLVLIGAGALLMLCLACALCARRDLGAGLFPDRTGRPAASPMLRSPWALAWRLQRGLFIGWLLAYIALSALMGSIISDLGSFMSTPQVAAMLASLGGSGAIVDAFIGMEFSVIAFVTAAYGITVARRITTEESAGHLEFVLSAAVSRTTAFASHVVIVILGTTILTVVQGVVFALADAQATGTTESIPRILGAAVVHLPAIWVAAGLAVVLAGAAPRLITGAWVALVGFILIAEIGALLKWPSWILDASPFAHTPLLPGSPMDWAPVLALSGIAALLLAAGFTRFTQRDLDTP